MGREMKSDIYLRQTEEMTSFEESDEALEGASGGLLGRFPTLAYGSYCFTCCPDFALKTASHPLFLATTSRWRWT
jgi:hypothetical protein